MAASLAAHSHEVVDSELVAAAVELSTVMCCGSDDDAREFGRGFDERGLQPVLGWLERSCAEPTPALLQQRCVEMLCVVLRLAPELLDVEGCWGLSAVADLVACTHEDDVDVINGVSAH